MDLKTFKEINQEKSVVVKINLLMEALETKGSCQIVQNKGNNGNTYNNIKVFYAPEDRKDSGGNKWAI